MFQFSKDRSTKALVAFMVANNHPFCFVEQPLLKELFGTFERDFNLISASTAKRMVVAAFDISKSLVRSIIHNQENGIILQ